MLLFSGFIQSENVTEGIYKIMNLGLLTDVCDILLSLCLCVNAIKLVRSNILRRKQSSLNASEFYPKRMT